MTTSIKTGWKDGRPIPDLLRLEAAAHRESAGKPPCDIDMEASQYEATLATIAAGGAEMSAAARERGWFGVVLRAPAADAARLAAQDRAHPNAAARVATRRGAWNNHPAVDRICAQIGEGFFDAYCAQCSVSAVEGAAKIIAPNVGGVRELARYQTELDAAFGGAVTILIQGPRET